MMRTEGFAVGSSWREGRERDRRRDNASSSIETRVLSLLSPRSLPLLEETGQVSFSSAGRENAFRQQQRPLFASPPLVNEGGERKQRGKLFFFSSVGSREKSDLFEKKFIRV